MRYFVVLSAILALFTLSSSLVPGKPPLDKSLTAEISGKGLYSERIQYRIKIPTTVPQT